MDKIETVKSLMKEIGMPVQQQSQLCCLTLLAMSSLKNDSPYEEATNGWIRIHDVIDFIREKYEIEYAENSRETFRKQAMHHFRTAAIIEDNGEATNSPNYRYRVTDEFLTVIKSLKKVKGNSLEDIEEIKAFLSQHQSLKEIYSSKKTMQKMPVKINNEDFTFSPGKHNQLQKAIIEEFAPRFAPNSECLYVGDTTEKDLVKKVEKLKSLGFEITLHDKMPDVVLYREDKDWIYFIESVTSVGPMDSKRIMEIGQMTENVTAGKIFVTAFLDFKTFKQFSESLAWETEVWIADMPEHMIHLNGDRFMGPRNIK
ncbi:MAG: restriction endonuclease [Paludibacteraceae bacterium]|nr:restriction endonuclease [Paludibacteraceae bacterium]